MDPRREIQVRIGNEWLSGKLWTVAKRLVPVAGGRVTRKRGLLVVQLYGADGVRAQAITGSRDVGNGGPGGPSAYGYVDVRVPARDIRYPIACIDHEDCREHPELGAACAARR